LFDARGVESRGLHVDACRAGTASLLAHAVAEGPRERGAALAPRGLLARAERLGTGRIGGRRHAAEGETAGPFRRKVAVARGAVLADQDGVTAKLVVPLPDTRLGHVVAATADAGGALVRLAAGEQGGADPDERDDEDGRAAREERTAE
jgi:hypothetical protein